MAELFDIISDRLADDTGAGGVNEPIEGAMAEKVSKKKRAKKAADSGNGQRRGMPVTTRPLDGGMDKMRCAHLGDNDGAPAVCGEYAGNPIHDPTMAYAGYHEFVAPGVRAANRGN